MIKSMQKNLHTIKYEIYFSFHSCICPPDMVEQEQQKKGAHTNMIKEWTGRAGKLSKAQQRIADYLSRNEGGIPYMTEHDIAENTGVSIATVSRFWKVIGFRNLKELKTRMKSETAAPPAAKLKDKLKRVSEQDVAGQMLTMEMRHLQDTFEHLSREDFQGAVETLAHARRVFVFGTGPSRSLCELFRFRFTRFGLDII